MAVVNVMIEFAAVTHAAITTGNTNTTVAAVISYLVRLLDCLKLPLTGQSCQTVLKRSVLVGVPAYR